jgi:hypothetical protein
MGRAWRANGEKRNLYWLLVGKPEGRRQLGRRRLRWVDNIKVDLEQIGWGGLNSALVNTILNLRVA